MRNKNIPAKQLSGLEHLVVEFLWNHGPASSETVREGLMKRHVMKEGTARTILRRLEAKGYVSHREEGRTYIYSSEVHPENVAIRMIRQIIDRFCGGSAQALVTGMVEQEVIDSEELRELSKKLTKLKREGKK